MATASVPDVVNRRLELVKREITEVMDLNQYDEQGRIIVKPFVGGIPRKTGETWYVCSAKCGFATLSAEKMLQHWKKEHKSSRKDGHDVELDSAREPSSTPQTTDESDNDDSHDGSNVDVESPSSHNIRYKQERNKKTNRTSIRHKLPKPTRKRQCTKTAARYSPCSICGKVIVACNLKRHVDSVHLGKTIPCQYCGIHFSRKYSLKKHVATAHVEGGKYACHLCSCTFSTLKVRRYHITRHSQKNQKSRKLDAKLSKRRKSSRCSAKASTSAPNKKTKMVAKLNPKEKAGVSSFECGICRTYFTMKKSLRKHFQRMHPGMKRFKCVHCGMMQVASGALQTHIEVAHSGGTCPCKFCTCTFATFRGKRTHVRNHHERP